MSGIGDELGTNSTSFVTKTHLRVGEYPVNTHVCQEVRSKNDRWGESTNSLFPKTEQMKQKYMGLDDFQIIR